MEITQRDRDDLRHSQQTKAQPFVIGNLVEHQIQDPARYKLLSRQEQGLDPNATLEPPTIDYRSKYLDTEEDDIDLQNHETNESEENVSRPMPTIAESLSDLPLSIEDVQANSWLNMNSVELDKLEWMSEKAEKRYHEKLRSTTHFDSEGRAVPPAEVAKYLEKSELKDDAKQDSVSSNLDGKIHDIGGLVKYLDSQFQPQVHYALCVITKIAVRATTGYYDGTFDENIHETLIRDCLLRVRHHIDSSNETTCQTALRCLRSLLCNLQIDEILLDRLHPIINENINETLWLNDESLSEQFNIDVSDSHCVQIDAILALVIRTNLLPRLVYLIKTKQGKFANSYNDCILDILIRLARHSRGVCLLMGDAGLVDIIIDNYLPVDVARADSFTQSMAIRALKFVRLMAQASRELVIKHKGRDDIKIPQTILKRVESYYYIETGGIEVDAGNTLLRVLIESLRLMKVLLFLTEFANHIHSIITMHPGLLLNNFQSIGAKYRSIQIVKPRISIDWQFAAHLIDLIGHLMNYEMYQMKQSSIQNIWTTYVRPITLQWLSDLIRERFIPHLDTSIAIASSVFHFPKCSSTQDRQFLMKVLLKSINLVKDSKENASLLYFNLLVKEAEKRSHLQNMLECDGRLRDPRMLSSYGFLNYNSSPTYNYQLNAIIENDSPLILLDIFTTVMYQNQSTARELITLYSDNVTTIRYLRCASCYFNLDKTYESLAQRSFLAQFELVNMIRLILLQVGYYMERRREDIVFGHRRDPEPDDIRVSKKESYSNLILSALSIVGLVNPYTEHLVALKDKLLDTTVLNHDLHIRLVRDIYRARPTSRQFDLAYYNTFGLDVCGERTFNILSEEDTFVLKSLYVSVEQPGRYWIFQPLIEYYNTQMKNNTEGKKSDDKWFSKGINIPNGDAEVVASILHLHAAIIHTSPSYNQFVLRPNIEEFLCLIGTIFLDDDLFLDTMVSDALKMNLEILVAECIEKRRIFTDASRVIKTLDLPLYDFFNKLVDQFESVSYGDPVFTNYLLLFITAKSDKCFKKKLFSEKLETCIGQMRIQQEQVWASSNLMFKQLEKDPEILDLIRRTERFVQPGSFMFTYRRKHLTQNDKV